MTRHASAPAPPKRAVASEHVHSETKTVIRYEATWDVEGPLLTWKATASTRGREWSLAGGTPDWTGGNEAKAVQKDVARSIDGIDSSTLAAPPRPTGPRRRPAES